MSLPDGFTPTATADAWHEKYDRVWDENPPAANPAFTRAWFLRCKDLIDSYQPDLIYFDDTGLALGQVGLDIAAHFYNASIKRHGKLKAVINAKFLPEASRSAIVEDTERGLHGAIELQPWQTDTLHRPMALQPPDLRERRIQDCGLDDPYPARYGVKERQPAPQRAGPQRRHHRRKGTAIVEGIASRMARFSEAIYGTRSWKLSGEGQTQVAAGAVNESKTKAFTAADIRSTTKYGALYAMTLGKPEAESPTITSLKNSHAEHVDVVGVAAPLPFKHDANGLTVSLPSGASHEFGGP